MSFTVLKNSLKQFLKLRVNMKLFHFFLVLMLFGGGFYMLKIRSVTDSIPLRITNYFMMRKNATEIPERYPSFHQVNFTFSVKGVRSGVLYPKNKSLLQLFRVALNSDERNVFLYTLATFANTLYKANITFMLYGGSMLGSRRHHGFIPWDDDVDVWINGTEKSRVKKLLASVKGFAVFSPKNFQWKFFYKNLTTLQEKNFRWPYIDIFFFNENSTHVWEEQIVHRYKYYNRSRIFPLIFRPFEVFRLPTPCAIEEFLGQYAFPDNCRTTNFIHRMERYLPEKYSSHVSCKALYSEHPFVFKSRFNETFSKEELKRGNKVISQFLLPSNACGITH